MHIASIFGLATGLLGVSLSGQPQPPLGIFHAELLSWDGQWDDGTLRLRLDSGTDYACTFNSRSFFERDSVRISPGRLRPGDRVELVTDRTSPRARCFARMIRVVLEDRTQSTWGAIRRSTEGIAPRGSLTFTGVIVGISAGSFVVRSRTGDRITIRLRRDTRILENGASGGAEILKMNSQVHVRAGMDPDDEIEAYQIVSGEILQPRGGPARQP